MGKESIEIMFILLVFANVFIGFAYLYYKIEKRSKEILKEKHEDKLG